ncbi:hypothetical protein BGZ83_004044 [Gryganskiella cystojenkinii]|nr:hypothetical protein BGZ83_004044 [Gryganskiella cystojenkinii]
MTDQDNHYKTTGTPSEATTPSSSDQGSDHDDVWGDDEDVSYDRSIAEKEWSRLHENFGNSGYLEGIEEGKESTLQEGFNQGWSEGVQYGHELGRLRGLISPLLEYILSTASPKDLLRSLNSDDKTSWIQKATDLIKELVELDIAKVFDKAYFDDGRGPSASSKADSKASKMDSGCCGGSKTGSGSCCKDESNEEQVDATVESGSDNNKEKKGCCSKSDGSSSTSCNEQSCGKPHVGVKRQAWSSRPDEVLSSYRSRTLDLLKQIQLEHLLESN